MSIKEDYIIFLDVDGVLNSAHHNKLGLLINRKDGLWGIAKECVDNLSILIKSLEQSYNVGIVLSTSWRQHEEDVTELKHLLDLVGFDLDKYLIGKTDVIEGAERGQEIVKYIQDHKVERYVILDDVAHEIITYVPVGRLIHTNLFGRGLTIKKVVKYLEERGIKPCYQ